MLARKSTAVRREGPWKDEARRGSLESSRTSLVSFKDNADASGGNAAERTQHVPEALQAFKDNNVGKEEHRGSTRRTVEC